MVQWFLYKHIFIDTNVSAAWRVDLNVSLSSFEPLIAGTRKLLDLALDSPLPGGPRVLFVSSISSAFSQYPYICSFVFIP